MSGSQRKLGGQHAAGVTPASRHEAIFERPIRAEAQQGLRKITPDVELNPQSTPLRDELLPDPQTLRTADPFQRVADERGALELVLTSLADQHHTSI